MAHFVGEIRSRIIPEYEYPVHSESGGKILMQAHARSPELITNTVLREAYAKAVSDEEQQGKIGHLQLALFNANGMMSFMLIRLSRRCILTGSGGAEFIEEITKAANLTREEQAKLKAPDE